MKYNNWETIRLGNVTKKIGSGATPTGGASNYKDNGISLIRSQNVLDLSFSKDGLVYIDDGQAKKLSNVIVEQGDILLNITGDSVARSCRVPDSLLPARVNQHVAIIRGDGGRLSNDFLLYYFQYIKPYLLSISGIGGTRNALTKKMIEDIMLNLPPIEEQRRIAGILGALDDKIECNNRINRNLEEQAAVLFRRWFVDFEFPDPHPTSPTYGKPYRSAGGKMTSSPLGPIPTAWQVGTFRDIISSTIGGDWGKESAEANYSQKVYCIRGADITDVSKGEKGKMPFRYILPKNHIAKKLEVNDLVIEISGGSPTQSTGRIAIISDSLLKRYDEDMICTNFCRAIKPKTEYAHFIYSLWRYMYDQNIMFSYENGTTGIKNININGLVDNEQIVIPPIEVLNNYNNLQKHFFNTVFTNALESETLATLRDTLLTKLMNNEIKTICQ